MKRLALVIGLLAAACFTTGSNASTVYSTYVPCNLGVDAFCAPGDVTYNGGSGYSFGTPFIDLVDTAMAFTPSADFTLDSIEVSAQHTVSLGQPVGSDLANVFLTTDSSGAPGSIIESFQVTMPQSLVNGSVSPPQLLAPLSATSLLNPLLSGGTRYWLVMSVVDPVTQAFWADSGRPPSAGGGGATTGLGAQRENGGAWVVNTNVQSAFAIVGTPAVPASEPGTLLLICVGVAMAMLKRRGNKLT
ncbi:MAG TPA: PEP-CTERM sorting domain-containing protein [Casimicrobiaceae bacterium]|jgi:hypothetical protein